MIIHSSDVKLWARQNTWIVWLAFGITMVTMLMIICCGELRRQTPHNFICLSIFTVAESFLLGIVSACYAPEIVLYAVLITLVVCTALTAFSFQTKIDFTVYNGVLFVGLIILMVFGFILMFVNIPVLHTIYSAVGALIFSAVSKLQNCIIKLKI